MNGKDFNSLGAVIPCKVLSDDLKHYTYQYKLGLNKIEDNNETFIPEGECKKGGLYFCNMACFLDFLDFGNKMAILEIPNDAQIYIEKFKFKTDRFIIKEIIELKNFYIDEYYNDKDLKEIVFYRPKMFEFIKNKTEELYKVVLRGDGNYFKDIKEQTEEICIMACARNGYNLEYVKEQTEKICLAACKAAPYSLQLVKNQTEEMCIIACSINGFALQHVREQTQKIIEAALLQNKNAKIYIKK